MLKAAGGSCCQAQKVVSEPVKPTGNVRRQVQAAGGSWSSSGSDHLSQRLLYQAVIARPAITAPKQTSAPGVNSRRDEKGHPYIGLPVCVCVFRVKAKPSPRLVHPGPLTAPPQAGPSRWWLPRVARSCFGSCRRSRQTGPGPPPPGHPAQTQPPPMITSQ